MSLKIIRKKVVYGLNHPLMEIFIIFWLFFFLFIANNVIVPFPPTRHRSSGLEMRCGLQKLHRAKCHSGRYVVQKSIFFYFFANFLETSLLKSYIQGYVLVSG